MKYLRMPLGAFFKARAVWDRVIEWSERKTSRIEEIIFVQRRDSHLNKEYTFEFAYVFFYPCSTCLFTKKRKKR